MEPAYVQARTSRPAFNAAVHAASTGDYLNLARCLARGVFPSTLVVGLGVEQMIVEAMAVEHPDPLAACANPDASSALARLRGYRGLLTAEQARASLRTLHLELRGRPAPRYTFGADGMVLGGETQPLEQAVEAGLAGNWSPGKFDAEGLRPANVAQVQKLLELSRERGAKVVVYLPPYQPQATDRYLEESRFGRLRGELLARLAAWAREYPVKAYDFTEIDSFGGRAEMFYDASHPSEDAFRLMIEAMLPDLV